MSTNTKAEAKAKIWNEAFRIRAYEVNPAARITIQSICNYLQEIAGNHAADLNVSVDRLIEMNLTWVLSRLHVQMTRYPFWRHQISIDTWPSRVDKFHAIRDFKLHDEKQRQIGAATSSWMLIDIKKRRPIQMPDFINVLHQDSPGRALEDNFQKLPELQTEQHTKFFNVRLSDLDMNQHVNNVNYIEWGLESIPEEINRTHALASVEISFKAESNYGDRVKSVSGGENEAEQLIVLHHLNRESDNKELARMKSIWRPVKK